MRDRATKKLVTKDVIVSLYVTDDSVFDKIEDRKQPPSVGAAVLLENEVAKNDYELYYSNQYIDHWFMGNDSQVDPDSKDRNLELLLGIQGWRANAFDLRRVYNVYSNINSLEDTDQIAYQQLMGKAFVS